MEMPGDENRAISAEALLRRVVGLTEIYGTEGEAVDVAYSIRHTDHHGPELGITYRLDDGETIEYVTDRYTLIRQVGSR